MVCILDLEWASTKTQISGPLPILKIYYLIVAYAYFHEMERNHESPRHHKLYGIITWFTGKILYELNMDGVNVSDSMMIDSNEKIRIIM